MKARIALTLAAGLMVVEFAHADTFAGYGCTSDCSGHRAGYEWAEQHGIEDESSCSTPSQSFNEGCAAYIEENRGSGDSSATDDDDESDDDDE